MGRVIPFYIVCFNRIQGLRFALQFVRDSSLPLEPIILDMGSTWEPFLQYRDSLNLEVVKFPYGIGPRDLWTKGEIKKLGSGGFFLTDGDIDFTDLPVNTAQKLKDLSDKYPWFPKIGLALRISDLPEDPEGARVLSWEADHWKVEFGQDIYLNGVDTTIAYYPRRELTFFYRPSLRLGGEFTARHYPWYERNGFLTDEAKYYYGLASANISSTQAGQSQVTRYKVKHKILLGIYQILRIPLKTSLLGPFAVKLISYKGTIRHVK